MNQPEKKRQNNGLKFFVLEKLCKFSGKNQKNRFEKNTLKNKFHKNVVKILEKARLIPKN